MNDSRNFGSLAMLLAIRRASSRVSRSVAVGAGRPRLILYIIGL
jgi:hypothetical protein